MNLNLLELRQNRRHLKCVAVPVFKVHCDVLAYDMSDRTVSHIFGGEGGNKEER